jgi:uncharacterized membrane protein
MSSVSQIAGPGRTGSVSAAREYRPADVIRFGASIGAVAVIVGLSVAPYAAPMLRRAGQMRLHAPDLAVWEALSTPVRIHLVTAVAALALGAALMIVRKGRAFHRLAGWTWVALVSATAGATLFISGLNHGSWSVLHLFTGWVLLGLPVAVIAAKRGAVARHRRHMMGLFYGGFAVNVLFAILPGRAIWAMFLG